MNEAPLNDTSLPKFYYNLLELPKNKHINLQHVGWDRCEPGYTFLHCRNSYILHYVINGKGTVEVNKKIYNVKEGQCVLVKPNQPLIQTADLDHPWEHCFFAFNGELADEMISHSYFKDKNVSGTLKNPMLHDYIMEAALILNNQTCTEVVALYYLFKFLSCLDFEDDDKTDNYKESIRPSHKKYVSMVHEYIQINYSKAITVKEIVKRLNINRSYLYRIFKENTGLSIHDYLTSVRINEARRLLHETDLPITNIAQSVGYEHYPTFFKTFKLYTGISPQEYRQRLMSSSHT